MKPNNQIISAVAELDGWKVVDRDEDNCLLSPDGSVKCYDEDPSTTIDSFEYLLPPYLTSRDAIIPVIEKAINTDELKRAMFDELRQLFKGSKSEVVWEMFIATPRQLCIALLKALGKWEE